VPLECPPSDGAADHADVRPSAASADPPLSALTSYFSGSGALPAARRGNARYVRSAKRTAATSSVERGCAQQRNEVPPRTEKWCQRQIECSIGRSSTLRRGRVSWACSEDGEAAEGACLRGAAAGARTRSCRPRATRMLTWTWSSICSFRQSG